MAPKSEQVELDPKWLKGLEFSGVKKVKSKDENGDPVEKSVPFTRDLSVDDVLDWKVYGDEAVIVTVNGRKERVKI